MRGPSVSRWLQPHDAASQKTAFFIVTVVKTSNLAFPANFVIVKSARPIAATFYRTRNYSAAE
jgi:hypothetical protein